MSEVSALSNMALNALLRDVGDMLEVGVVSVDTHGTIIGWNRWLESVSGHRAADVLGRSLPDLFPSMGPAAIAALDRAVAGATVVLSHGFHRFFLPLQSPIDHGPYEFMQQNTRLLPIVDANGNSVGATAIIQDVTERVHREAELRLAIERAEAANRAKSAFLASMSHELRTPIGAVAGYTDLLRDGIFGEVTPAQVVHLERIKRVSAHLLHIVEEILTFARVEAGREEVRITETDAGTVALEASAVIQPMLEKKGLHFDICVPETAVIMHTDAVKVRQIMINLLGNAVKFSSKGTISLDVRVDEPGTQVAFIVSDEGPGIDEENLERIFEPFTQVESTLSRTHEGTGLGLPVSRQLARLMGGDLVAESVKGKGSTFTVLLPIVSSPYAGGTISGEHLLVGESSS
jgi:signal transduction histidine kinase